jgi:hypothetical protein
MFHRSEPLLAKRIPHGVEADRTPGRPEAVLPNSAAVVVAIEGRLQASPYRPLRDVGCAGRDGVVILKGRLPTQYLKQVAPAIATEAALGLPIDNRIEVTR